MCSVALFELSLTFPHSYPLSPAATVSALINRPPIASQLLIAIVTPSLLYVIVVLDSSIVDHKPIAYFSLHSE